MDETLKERLGKWVYSDALWRSALGTIAKFGIEWTIWGAVFLVIAAGCVAVFESVSLTVALRPDSVFLWWTTTVTVITLGTWCYGAVEPE